MRTKKLLIVLVFALISTQSFSQKLEYSGFFDSYYYKGIRNLNFTLNGGLGVGLTDMAELQPAPAFGVGVNYKLWPRMMFGVEFHYLMLAGKDNQSNRNLTFTSTNYEFLGYARFYFVDDIIRIAADRTRGPKFFKAYLMTGIGLLRYTPVATYTELPPITDTAFFYPEPAGGLGPVIPVALGFSWRISNKLSLITEIGYRKTFTDYLDGISLRANPKNKDGYLVADLKIQISPFAKSKKKSKSLPPPAKYEGPKGTETWKNRKKEEPVQKRNNYYDMEEETPVEEQQFDEEGNPIEPAPKEEEPVDDGWGDEPTEEQPTEEEPVEEEPVDDGWD